MDEEGTVASVSLLILAEDLEPEVVTRALRLFPDRAWRKGDQPPVLAQRGILGPPTVRGGWKKRIPDDWSDRRVEEQLEFWATSLRERSSGIDHLCSLGYEVVLDCFVAPRFPYLLELSGSLQAQIGALNINVDMHFFADRRSETNAGGEDVPA